MTPNKPLVGPASYLLPGYNWLDDKVAFRSVDRGLGEVALMLWKITRQMRARQGERGLSNYEIGWMSGVRRQTVSEVLMGKGWPDTKTLGTMCLVLDLDLSTIDKPETPTV